MIELFGDDAGAAARQHVVRDLREEGWSEKTYSPRMQLIIMMGLF